MDPRGADCYFDPIDNIKAGAGDKGTLAIWQWPLWYHDNPEMFWRLDINDTNYMRQYRGRSLQVKSAGTIWEVSVARNTPQFQWDHLVYTWDFTVAGQGRLEVYWNGVLSGTPVQNANAPVGTPTRLVLGPYTASAAHGPHMIQSLAIWDDVITPEQVAAAHFEGPRHRITEGDGTGNLTLYASFNGRHDADVAAGDATFKTDGPADRYCLIDDGAREQGRRRFLIGQPRHDLSEDDRVPLCAPCPLTVDFGRSAYVADTNYANYGSLQIIPGYGQDRRLGGSMTAMPLLEGQGLSAPSTFRQRVHIPNDNTPAGTRVRLGPVDYLHYPTESTDVFDQWGTGRQFAVQSDAANSVTNFKTDLDSRYGAGYWAGASVTMLTGNCAGRRLLVADYDNVTKILTLETGLPAIPDNGSVGIVDHRARLQGCRSWGSTTHGLPIPEANMDAWLWEFNGASLLFTELEWQFVGPNDGTYATPNVLRYDHGRTVSMDGAQHSIYEGSAVFGKPGWWSDNTLSAKILLERLDVDGPGTYQLLRRGANGDGPDLADNFMVASPTGESTKVWRKQNVARVKSRPAKCADAGLVKAALEASGTWRSSVSDPPIPVIEDPTNGTVTALVVGADGSGVSRLGYVVGSWDEATSRIQWVDEQPPAGRSNPFMLLDELTPTEESDGPVSSRTPKAVFAMPDGKWALTYVGQTSHPDHFMTFMLCGAEDRWSFSREKHWWRSNPLAPISGGPDVVAPDGNGSGVWANRDAGWIFFENPYSHDASKRYMAVARGKTIHQRAAMNAVDLRPLIGLRGSDPRSMLPLPHGNGISPLAGPLVHACNAAALGQGDCLGLYTDTAIAASSGVYCYVSEDGIHYQLFAHYNDWIPNGELPGEPMRLYPGRPFRLGDKRVYYYFAGSYLNYGWLRLDGEAAYGLEADKLEGLFETALIERPDEGWGDLRINASPGGGSVAVEVLDGYTETAAAGFTRADFDGATDSVDGQATWTGKALDALGTDVIRLRFVLSRENAADETARVYAWQLAPKQAVEPPWLSGVRVEGQTNPTNVADPTPEFSWEYHDPAETAQSAYQVLVASSQDLLDQNTGDVWDSGVVESGEVMASYGGASLASESLYHWKVRVRNAQGVWSEEW